MGFAYALLMIGVALCGYAVMRARRKSVRTRVDPESGEYFRERCQKLLETNRLDELIACARDRIRKRPNHTYAHWYLARALYLQRKWKESLASFNEVARLDPSWIEKSVTPHVRAIEAKLQYRETPVAPDAPEQPRTLH